MSVWVRYGVVDGGGFRAEGWVGGVVSEKKRGEGPSICINEGPRGQRGSCIFG